MSLANWRRLLFAGAALPLLGACQSTENTSEEAAAAAETKKTASADANTTDAAGPTGSAPSDSTVSSPVAGNGATNNDATSADGTARDSGPGDGFSDAAPGEQPTPAPPMDAETTEEQMPPPKSPVVGGDKVGVFVAQGHLARTIISCDGGKTWIFDQSDVTDNRCWTDAGIECDHQPTAGRGITFGDGYFYATYGWGKPGSIRRSSDGENWETVHEGENYAGIAYGAGVTLAGSRHSIISTGGGAWEDAAEANFKEWNVRRVGYAEHDGGRFVLVADGPEVLLSSSAGQSWWSPDKIPAGCGANIQTEGGIAYGNGTLVVMGGDGNACASADGGKTWTMNNVSERTPSQLVHDGNEFFIWGDGNAYHSANGTDWTTTPLSSKIQPGPASYGNGSFVSVKGGWQQWYEKQEFYRSNNGIDWEVIGAGTFADSGHPIRDMAFGWLTPTQRCK